MQLSNVFARFLRAGLVVGSLLAPAIFVPGCADLSNPCLRGTAGCACRSAGDPAGACDNSMICAAGTCFAPVGFGDRQVCYDACTYRRNGQCDDGGNDPSTAHCSFGTDCTDCGPRENPCPPNSPVYCPQRIQGASQCYPAGTDCLTLRTCDGNANKGPFTCPTGQQVDCSMNGACIVVSSSACTNPAAPVECVDEGVCVGPFTNCNSFAACPTGSSNYGACFYSETLVCNAGVATCSGF